MNQSPFDLHQLQSWMQAVITHPGGLSAGISSVDACHTIDVALDDLEDVVTRSTTLSAAERLAIYSRSYVARLLECFHAEYPCLTYALGRDLFNAFVADYLHHYPPRSYTLHRLAEHFPHHLATTRPDAAQVSDQRETWPDFIVDLARLERAFMETYDGPGAEGESLLNPAQWRGLSEVSRHRMRLVPVPCLRLLAFQFPVATYFTAFRAGDEPPFPSPQATTSP